MRPHAGIIPLGHAAGKRPRHVRIEVSIIVPFSDEASVSPHCLERLQRIGEQLAVPRAPPFVDDGSRDGAAEYMTRQAETADPAGAHEPQFRQGSRHDGRRLSDRKAVDVLPQLPERNRCMKGLLPGSAWRPE